MFLLLLLPCVVWGSTIRWNHHLDVGAQHYSATCHVTLPALNGVIEIPPDYIIVDIGREDGEYHYSLKVDTVAGSEEECTASIEISVTPKDANENRAVRRRYSGSRCQFDNDGKLTRQFIVHTSPVTARDGASWECRALWRYRQMTVIHVPNFVPVWRLPRNYTLQYPVLSVLPYEKARPGVTLVCRAEAFDYGLARRSLNKTLLVPQLKLAVTVEDSLPVERDVYGRFVDTTLTLSNLAAPYLQCTSNESTIVECFARSHMGMGDKQECYNYAIIVSPATKAALGEYITPPASTSSMYRSWTTPFVLTNLLEDWDNECALNSSACSNPSNTSARLDFDMDRRHLVIQLPSIRPLKLHTSPTPKVFRISERMHYQLNYDMYMTHLTPDWHIIEDFYSRFLHGIRNRPRVRVYPAVAIGNRTVTLQCGPLPATLLFIASGSCGEGKLWCGEGTEETNGWYKVVERELAADEQVLVTKHGGSNNEMTCIWRQYFCLTGYRTQPIESVVYVEEEEKDDVSPEYERIIRQMCPYGEERGASTADVPVVIFRRVSVNVRRMRTHAVDAIRKTFKDIRVTPMRTLDQLRSRCPCQRIGNLCDPYGSKYPPPGHLMFTTISTALKYADLVRCYAMGRYSAPISYGDVVAAHVCSSPEKNPPFSMLPLPQPVLEPLHDTDEVRITYSGVNEQCTKHLRIQFHTNAGTIEEMSLNQTMKRALVVAKYSRVRIYYVERHYYSPLYRIRRLLVSYEMFAVKSPDAMACVSRNRVDLILTRRITVSCHSGRGELPVWTTVGAGGGYTYCVYFGMVTTAVSRLPLMNVECQDANSVIMSYFSNGCVPAPTLFSPVATFISHEKYTTRVACSYPKWITNVCTSHVIRSVNMYQEGTKRRLIATLQGGDRCKSDAGFSCTVKTENVHFLLVDIPYILGIPSSVWCEMDGAPMNTRKLQLERVKTTVAASATTTVKVVTFPAPKSELGYWTISGPIVGILIAGFALITVMGFCYKKRQRDKNCRVDE